MFKKISCFLVFIILFGLKNVNAATYYDKIDEHGMWIKDEFVNKSKNGNTKYQQMTLIVRKSDNRYLYCIEPGKSIDENKLVIGYDTDLEMHANLTSLQRDRIQLLAYYGYGYGDHTDIKWYVITQFMIWQTNNLGYDIYFTDKLNGNRIDKYVSEMAELDNLVNRHFIVPNVKNGKINAFINEQEEIEDINNVLNEYEMTGSANVEAFKNGNKMNVKINDFNEGYLLFKKEKKRFGGKSIVYVDEDNQNLLLPGDLSTVFQRINIKPIYGSVSIQKLDSDTKNNAPNHEGTLLNAKYGLYSNKDILLEEQLTDKTGKINFNTKLSKNRYYIQEISPSVGYQLDQTKYYFDIDKDNYLININTYEKVISENFEIIKTLENNKTGILEFEKGVKFGIYNKNDELIDIFTTDDFGTIKFKLNYGTYKIKQLTSYEQYDKIDDFQINVRENDKYNKMIFQDNKIKYKVKLNVYEKYTKKPIKNIKFEIYNGKNEQICEDNKCIYTSDENGVINYNNYFDFDKYYIKLIHDENFNYIYDDDILKFEINNNSSYKEMTDYRLIELEYFLTEKKEQPSIVEKTNNNVIIENPIEQIENEIINDEILDSDEIIVEVPNTISNNDYTFLIIVLSIYAIKNYFKNKVII